MKLEDIPKKVLSHTGCAVCGFLIALWCQETTIAGQNHRKIKPGVTVTLRSREGGMNDQQTETADNLAVVSQISSELCKRNYSGLLIRHRGKFIQVIGEIDNLDSAVKIVEGLKTGNMEITTENKAATLPPCQELPLITYGNHP